MMIWDRDPDEVGAEHPDDTELRLDTIQSIHDFDPDPDTGKCRAHLIRHGVQGAVCGSTQSYSVFHNDNRTWCCSLSEQGIDCGHGEDYDY
jgi:hypothetical protein